MKTRPFLPLVLSALMLAMLASIQINCRLGTNLPHDPPIYDTNYVAKPFFPGLLITFPNLPTEGVLNLLKECPAKKVSEKEWVIEVYDENNDWHRYAIQQAQRERAVLTGWRSTP